MVDSFSSVGSGNSAGINFSGVASGIDTESIISALSKLEHRPVDIAQAQQNKFSAANNLVGQLASKIKVMRDKLLALTNVNTSKAFAATSGDPTKVTATATSGAIAGSHTVEVVKLAQANAIHLGGASGSFTTADAAVGTGTFRVNYDGNTTGDIDLTGMTLNQVVSAINDKATGAVASAVNIGTSANPDYRLVLTGTKTGSTETISTTAAGGTSFGAATTITAAQDAVLKVDGLQLTRDTNNVSDVLQGVTINLLAQTSGPVTLTVSTDVLNVKQKITDFVNSYNDIAKFINANNTYDSKNKVAGAFFGDSAVASVQNQFRSALLSSGSSFQTDESYNALGILGITQNQDGTLAVDDAKLTTKLSADMGKVLDFFGDKDGSSGPDMGLAKVLSDIADKAVSSSTDPDTKTTYEGILQARQSSLQRQIDSLQDVIDRGEAHVADYTKQLRDKYTAFEQSMGQLKAQQSALSAKFG